MGQDFRKQGCSASISKIICRELVHSHDSTVFVENLDAATVHSTGPSCIANCSRFVFVPQRAMREPFAFKIPSIMCLARSDFVLIHPSLRRESSRQDSSTSGRASPRFRRLIVSVQVLADIGDLSLASSSARDKLHLGPGRERVPTAGETERPSADGCTPCFAKCRQIYRHASRAGLA